VLREAGIVEALRWWGERVAERHGLEVKLSLRGSIERSAPEVETAVFMAAKELIHNAVKHASAHHIDISITCDGRSVRIEVADDGVGFDAGTVTRTEGGGFGLTNVRERMAYLGGALEIASQLGQGTRATLVLPLPCEPHDESSGPTAQP
jgi:signal transduction histidine kinase